jgi:HEAT repeat protein
MGAPIAQHLVRASRSSDASVRWAAIEVLGTLAEPSTVTAVLDRVLGDDDVHVRWRAVWAMTRFGEDRVIGRLLSALSKRDRTTALNAAVALSVLGRTEGLRHLLKGVRLDDPFRQWEAVNALGNIHKAGVVSELLSLLSTGNDDVRRETALSLGRIGSRQATASLTKSAGTDRDEQVRWRAALALERIGDPSAVPSLKRYLRRESDPSVRQQLEHAITALAQRRGNGVRALPVEGRTSGRAR